jgi:hypothetical protein
MLKNVKDCHMKIMVIITWFGSDKEPVMILLVYNVTGDRG